MLTYKKRCRRRRTYVDPTDPLQGADHGGLRNGVTSVENKDEDGETGYSLSGRRRLERRCERTEPGLHSDSHCVHQ
jgi:hypothetical protein